MVKFTMLRLNGNYIYIQHWRKHNKALYKYLYKETLNDLKKAQKEVS
jgi:hypothetical protein